KIADYTELLTDHDKLVVVLREDLIEIRDRFGDDRQTEIQDVEDEIDIEDLIVRQDCAYTLTHAGYIKRMPTSAYRTQNRGGRGVNAMTTREEDFVKFIFTGSTHDYVLLFSNLGKVYRLKGYQIPESGRSAKGSNIVNLLEIDRDEKITAMFPISEFTDDKYMVFVTRQGIIKRVVLSDLQNIRKSGLRALGLNEDDELVDVRLTDGTENIMIGTHNGRIITFPESDARAMGRTAVGVRGIKLEDGDFVIGAARARKGAEVLTITENGYGKRTPVEEFTVHGRGGKGMTLHGLTEKTGKIAGMSVVDNDNDVMIITDDGVVIKTPCDQIRVCGRASQGVIVMRTAEDVKVISITRSKREEEETASEAAPEE
ncbi:MAG: DNA gyrase subunit A, partial [Butyricicoccus sp.]|nr:DNA gyrase subunit A [Butyricicoccus sp.]